MSVDKSGRHPHEITIYRPHLQHCIHAYMIIIILRKRNESSTHLPLNAALTNFKRMQLELRGMACAFDSARRQIRHKG